MSKRPAQEDLFSNLRYVEADLTSLPKNQKEAAEIGSSYFFTGNPCARGHVFMRYAKGGRCAYCQREQNAAKLGKEFIPEISYASRFIKRREAFKSLESTYVPVKPCKHGHLLRWTASNNCVECGVNGKKKHRDAGRFARIKKLYGLSRQDYFLMVEKQQSQCAICQTMVENHFNLHIDHCHSSGKVRGLLCSKCNQAIGLFSDSVENMRKAIAYVENEGAGHGS